jgi:protein-disulfide isomerase
MSKFRYAAMSRRAALTGAALASMALMAGCGGGDAAATGDMGMGAPEGAKVTVVEYASVTCVHCAEWQRDVWPQFKAKYVDTNKVRYVFREYLTALPEVGVAGFLIARCAGDDKYFDVVHQIMGSQGEWQAGISPRDTLFRVAAAAGLSQEQTQACITDKDAIKAFEQRFKAAQNAGINATPTFEVNGVRVADRSLESLSRVIDAELAK